MMVILRCYRFSHEFVPVVASESAAPSVSVVAKSENFDTVSRYELLQLP